MVGNLASSALRYAAAVLAAVAVIALAGCGDSSGGASSGSTARSAKVGVLLIAEAKIFDQIVAGYKEGFVEASGLPAGRVTFDVKNAQGDNSLVQNLARVFARGHYDQVAVLGTPAIVALSQQSKERPIIAINMADPVSNGVAKSAERPGTNVTGTIDELPAEAVAKYLAGIHPRPTRLGNVYNAGDEKSARYSQHLRDALKAQGIGMVEASAANAGDVSVAARSVVGKKVDGIVVGADALVAGAGLPAVGQIARSAKLPLYVAAGVDPSTPGVVAVMAPNEVDLGRLAGTIGGKVFRGAKPAETAFQTIPPKLAINKDLAAAEAVRPPSTFGATG